VLTANQHEAQRPLLFLLVPLGLSGLELSELFAIGENQIHVFIEGFELADEGSSVLQNDAHSIIQMRRHLVTLAHRHLEGSVETKAQTRDSERMEKVFKEEVLSSLCFKRQQNKPLNK